MKKTLYTFLKRKYPKYSLDYDIYTRYSNISYIIVVDNMLIKREYKDNQYDEGIMKYKIVQALRRKFN